MTEEHIEILASIAQRNGETVEQTIERLEYIIEDLFMPAEHRAECAFCVRRPSLEEFLDYANNPENLT